MTTERIKRVRVLAHSRKGLDPETYRLRLGAIGATSTTQLTREQYGQLIAGLRTLPDAPTWRTRP